MSFKKTEFCYVPMDWNIKKLDEFIVVLTDYHANGSYKVLKENVELLDEKNYAIMIRTTNFEQNAFDETDFKYITKEAYKFLAKSKVYKDDILMNKIANAGSVYIMPDLKRPVSLAMNLFLIRLNPKSIDQRYGYYFMKANEANIKTRATGSVTKTITKQNVRNLEIAYPHLEEQKVIADTLSVLDHKIELNNKINENLEAQAQAIFKHWFIDFEFPDENGNPYKSSGGEMVESELGMIPKRWKVVKLGDKFNFVKGKVPEYTDKGQQNAYPYLTKKVLDGNWNEVEYGITNSGIRCEPLDVLMLMDGANSSQVYYGYDGLVGSTLSLIDTKNVSMREILYMYFHVYNNELRNQNTGSAIPHANKDYINNIRIAIPSNEIVLKNIANFLMLIRIKILKNRDQNQTLSKLRDILLPKLMSGEIRIPLDEQ